MTTIIGGYEGRTPILVADRRVTHDSALVVDESTKLYKFDTGMETVCLGTAGPAGCETVIKANQEHLKQATSIWEFTIRVSELMEKYFKDDFWEGLFATTQEILYFSHSYCKPVNVVMAIGSGRKYALGAASALFGEMNEVTLVSAINIAAKYDPGTGGEPQIVRM